MRGFFLELDLEPEDELAATAATKNARATFAKWTETSQRKVHAAYSKLKLGRQDRRQLERMIEKVSASDPRLCSDLARKALFDAVLVTIMRYFAEHGATVKFYLGTACFDDGLTFENEPDVDLDRIIRILRSETDAAGLDATFLPDLDTFTRPFDCERNRRVSFHYHFIVITHGKFHPKTVEKALNKETKFKNPLGPVYTLRSKRKQTWRSVAGLALYVAKPIVRGKKRVWRDKNQDWTMLRDPKGFTNISALRLKEICSAIPVNRSVFGVGPIGKAFCRAVKKEFRETLQQLPGKYLAENCSDVGCKELWQRIWQDRPIFKPVKLKIRPMGKRDPDRPNMKDLGPNADWVLSKCQRLHRSGGHERAEKAHCRWIRSVYRLGRHVEAKRLHPQLAELLYQRDGKHAYDTEINDFARVIKLIGFQDGKARDPEHRRGISARLFIAQTLRIDAADVVKFVTKMTDQQLQRYSQKVQSILRDRWWAYSTAVGTSLKKARLARERRQKEFGSRLDLKRRTKIKGSKENL